MANISKIQVPDGTEYNFKDDVSGYEANQNAFSNVKVGSTTIAADSATDTIELIAGSNITLTPDATNDTVTIASSGGGSSTTTIRRWYETGGGGSN